MKFHVSKNKIKVLVMAIAIVFAIALVLLGIRYWDSRVAKTAPSLLTGETEDGRAKITVNGVQYSLKDNVQSILFMGIDKFEDDEEGTYINNQQADAIMLLVIDHDAERYDVLQLNRDTMTEIETLGVLGDSAGTVTAQLALSHAYGTGANDSARNVVHAVSDLLYGAEIAQFISLKMDAIPVLNDDVGGVEVELLDDFTMLDESFTEGTTVTLHGDNALAYIRYRGQLEDSSNISRMSRQRQYITNWLTAYRNARESDELLTAKMVADVGDYLTTDLTANQIDEIIGYIDSYTTSDILVTEGTTDIVDGHTAFYVDEDALQKQVLDLFYESVDK